MARYPEMTRLAFKIMEPGTVLSYLFRLAKELTACLDEADEEEESDEAQSSAASSVDAAQVALYDGVRQLFENALKLLGVTPVNK